MKKQPGNFFTRLIARYLTKTSPGYRPLSVTDPALLRQIIEPGDVLLVEGNQRVSAAIKYLTQSTWSHAALYIGEGKLVEADLKNGVIAVPLTKYSDFHTRICRPVGLTDDDKAREISYATERIGMAYDLDNLIDLLRYMLPEPPVPVRWRRRMIKSGSSDPTRAICSTLIAQAFQSVRYPILPKITRQEIRSKIEGTTVEKEILQIRDSGLFTPRDFDLSPYFAVVKPTLETGFQYQDLAWHDLLDADS